MIAIESNVRQVIARIGRFQRGVDSAVRSALDQERWLPVALNVARMTLEANAKPEDRKFIAAFLHGISAHFSGNILQISLERNAMAEDEVVSEAMAIMERLQTRQYGDVSRVRRQPLASTLDEQLAINRVNEAIEQWVQEKKDLSLEEQAALHEGSLSYADIARNIRIILFDPKLTAKGVTEAGRDIADVREGLARNIQAFMAQQQNDAALLDSATIELWLTLVLAAWKAMVLDQLGPLIAQELKKEANRQSATLDL